MFDAAGNQVAVAPRVAAAPPSCIKCGGHGHVDFEYYKRDYVPPLIYLAFFVSPLLVLILALALRKRHELSLPFCEECSQKFKRSNKMANFSMIGFILIFVVGVIATISFNLGLPVLLAGVTSIGLLIYGLRKKKKDSPVVKSIDGKQIVIADPVHGDIQFLKP